MLEIERLFLLDLPSKRQQSGYAWPWSLSLSVKGLARLEGGMYVVNESELDQKSYFVDAETIGARLIACGRKTAADQNAESGDQKACWFGLPFQTMSGNQ